jgi:hypothetical protein
MSSPGKYTPEDEKKDDISERYEDKPHKEIKSLEERQAQLQAALLVDPGASTWSVGAFYVCSSYMQASARTVDTITSCTSSHLSLVVARGIVASMAQ